VSWRRQRTADLRPLSINPAGTKRFDARRRQHRTIIDEFRSWLNIGKRA